MARKTDKRKRLPHPMQPVGLDEHGVARFKENAIINRILDSAQAAGYGLNQIAIDVAHDRFTREDYEQFNQLIGYSVCGYCDLSKVRDKSKDAAWAAMEQLK